MIGVCNVPVLSGSLAIPTDQDLEHKRLLPSRINPSTKQVASKPAEKASVDDSKVAHVVATWKNLTDKNSRKNRLPRDFGQSMILQETVHLDFGNDGYPTEESLQKLAQSKLLRAKRPEDIYVKAVSGGVWTDRVYAVGLKALRRPIFFFKISSKAASADSIIKLQKSIIGRLGINPRYADTKFLIPKDKLPIICWIEAIFSYRTPSGYTDRIEVIHAAHGVNVDHVINFGRREEIRSCGKSFGLGLGLFQQVFMSYPDKNDASTWRTVAHSDLHDENFFFDVITGKIYWIDIDTMLSDQLITIDLENIFKYYYSSNLRMKEFASAALLHYIASFSPVRRLAIKALLKKRLSVRHAEQLGLYDVRDSNPLVAGIISNDEHEVERLLRSGVSPFEGNKDGQTPFEWAIWKGNLKMGQLLMNYGVNINAMNNDAPSFLSLAIDQAIVKNVEFLLSLGADINLPDRSWDQSSVRHLETPLHRAVDVGDVSTITTLLKSKKINVNALNKGGQTALFRLAIHLKEQESYTADDLVIAKMLVDAGINSSVKDKKGKTAFDIIPATIKEHFSFLKPKPVDPRSTQQLLDLLKSAGQAQALKTERALSVIKNTANVVRNYRKF